MWDYDASSCVDRRTYAFDYARLFAANQRFSAARNDGIVIYLRFSASVRQTVLTLECTHGRGMHS